MNTYLLNLIAEGEHQQLDFKFEIADSRKIARSLVAFANTDGGKLLVGVKDNGKIAGVRSDEELHMLEAAAELYCRPKVPFKVRSHLVNSKVVLEVTIEARKDTAFMVKDYDNTWKAYVRVNDQNILANQIFVKSRKRKHQNNGQQAVFTGKEQVLLKYLEENPEISLSKFTKIAVITRKEAEDIILNLISVNLISFVFTEKGVFYKK